MGPPGMEEKRMESVRADHVLCVGTGASVLMTLWAISLFHLQMDGTEAQAKQLVLGH